MIRKIPQETSAFRFYNANPKDRRTGDCVIRAIAGATGKSWDEVLTDLTKLAIKYKVMPNDKACYGRYLESLGWTKRTQPRKGDNTKYTGSEWCEKLTSYHKKGYDNVPKNIIAHIGCHHIVCIKMTEQGEFKVHDIWNSSRDCIGVYWTKE